MAFEDTGSTYDPLATYKLQATAAADSMGVLDTAVHGAVAVMGDIAATTFNSVVPEKIEVDTHDLLGRIDQSALQVYNEHPDAVRLASFVGGMALPIGIATKGLALARAGAKGVGWFSKAGEVKRLADVENAFKLGSEGAEAYRKARTAYYTAMGANVVTDMVAAQAAIDFTLNAHPYMEDYMKDWGSNFLFNVVIGSAIGGSIGTVIARKAFKDITMNVDKELMGAVLETVKPVDEAKFFGAQFVDRHQNVANIKAHIEAAEAGKIALSPRTVEGLRLIAKKAEHDQIVLFKEMAPTVMDESVPVPIQEFYRNIVANDPSFAAAEKVDFLKVTPLSGGKKAEGSVIQKVANLFKTNEEGKTVRNDAVYSPVFEAWIPKNQAYHYSTLADLDTSIEKLSASIDKSVGWKPRQDAVFEHEFLSTAEVEADYAKALLAMERQPYEALIKSPLASAPDDLATMKAIRARLSTLQAEGKDISAVKIVLTKEAPGWETQKIARVHNAGFPLSYLNDIKEIDKSRNLYSLFRESSSYRAPDISETTANIIDAWTYGNYNSLRRAALQITNPKLQLGADDKYIRAISEMSGSAKTSAFKEKLASIADSDGFVLMYRGMKNDPKGHHALESYTLNAGKGQAFTGGYDKGLRMYKVHLDDIVGMIEDFGTTMDKSNSNMEILVMRKAARESDIVPTSSLDASKVKFFKTAETVIDPLDSLSVAPSSNPAVTTVTASELDNHILQATKDAVKMQLKMGMGAETISMRTGTPIETVKQIVAGGKNEASGLLRFSSTLDIEKAAAQTNRALAVQSNVNKIPAAQIFSELNKQDVTTISQLLVERGLLSSSSEFVKDIGTKLLTDELKADIEFIKKGLGEISAEGLGTTLLRSSNSVLENLGPVGAMINGIGKIAIEAKNTAREQFTKPMAQAMEAVTKSEAHVIEFNTAINVQASIPGWKMFRNGKWWRGKVPPIPFNDLVKLPDAEFATVVEKYGLEAVTFNSKEYSVVTPSVIKAIEEIQSSGRQMYALRSVPAEVRGLGKLPDIGFWSPAANPTGKEIAYVINTSDQSVSMIMAKSVDELKAKMGEFRKSLGVDAKLYDIVTKGDDQKYYNIIKGRNDPLTMKIADVSMQHGGSSARTVVSTNTEVMADIVQGYDHYLGTSIDDILGLQLNPILEQLDNISILSRYGYNEATKSTLQKMSTSKVDPGRVMENILFGRSNPNQHSGWVAGQNFMQSYMDRGLRKISTVMGSHVGGKGLRTPESWKDTVAQMGAEGIVNPFQTVIDHIDETGVQGIKSVANVAAGEAVYLREGQLSSSTMTPRLVALQNSLAATVVLRFGDVAQPLVNILSLPILTSGAINKRMAASFMGTAIDPMAKFSVTAAMYDGIRLMNSDMGSSLDTLATKAGLFKDDWRTVNGILKKVRTLEPGVTSKIEDALDSKLVEWMSTGADKSEHLVRRVAFFTGAGIAKRAYPGLPDAGVMTFARNFMDETIGNYAAAQRPAIFQGTVGVAMGLFQTYMLTMAQQIFRQVETKNWKALGKMMLTQQTIFGASSLPGFHIVSETIADKFSDQNWDLQTGMFRALNDEVAEIILYGLPSQLAGLTTRGDIQPRLPNPFDLQNSIAAINMTKQAYNTLERVATAAYQADANTGKAMLEALSLQSLNRPVARVAELFSGHAITASGKVVEQNTLSTDGENIDYLGMAARVMGTRPLREIKAREAMHLDTIYGKMDREKRQQLSYKLKSYVENGTLDQEKLSNLGYEYLRTGSPNGWRAAVSEAYLQSSRPGNSNVLEHLSPNSPTMTMIDDLD